mmetsp:Transcript_35974/g.61964  ORF Transcript_35974/g.61964 Transcript_35974/m.61964 type:complete len:210 (-) Transcript_35974:2716-3345(-)
MPQYTTLFSSSSIVSLVPVEGGKAGTVRLEDTARGSKQQAHRFVVSTFFGVVRRSTSDTLSLLMVVCLALWAAIKFSSALLRTFDKIEANSPRLCSSKRISTTVFRQQMFSWLIVLSDTVLISRTIMLIFSSVRNFTMRDRLSGTVSGVAARSCSCAVSETCSCDVASSTCCTAASTDTVAGLSAASAKDVECLEAAGGEERQSKNSPS